MVKKATDPDRGPAVRAPTSINIDRALWKAFKTECARRGETVTAQMERQIQNFLQTHGKRTPKQRV